MKNSPGLLTYALAVAGGIIGALLWFWFFGIIFCNGITLSLLGPSVLAVLAAIGLGITSGLLRSTNVAISNIGVPAPFAGWGLMCLGSPTPGAILHALAVLALAAGIYATGMVAALVIRRHGRRPSSIDGPAEPS